jgi:hypothetical protein
MRTARFDALLFEGHKRVLAVRVPFDPEAAWRMKPVRLAGRRHGWLVKGTANRVRFVGYVGERWGRFFITIDQKLRSAAGVAVGDVVSMVIAPTATRGAYVQACQQSERTTQPGRPRPDAVAFRGSRRIGRANLARRTNRRGSG